MRILRNRLKMLRREGGYSMATVMVAMLAGTAVSLGAYSAAGGDIKLAQDNLDQKRALAAAEAGVADYLQKLAQDNDYWLKCTAVTGAPVNQPWNGTGADPRVWRTIPGDPKSAYTIELLPRSPYTTCQSTADQSMLDSSGTIRVRVTGRSGPPTNRSKRSLVTTLRRNGFLDFLYFTEYETRDPSQFELSTGGDAVKRCNPNQNCAQDDIVAWAGTACAQYVRDGRNNVRYPGSKWDPVDNRWELWPASCTTIQFITGDVIKGPFHTNDTMSICGSPIFGRNTAGDPDAPVDRVEFYDYNRVCSGNPQFGNNLVVSGPELQILQLPQSNTQLTRYVSPSYWLRGRQTIVLNGNQMTVNGVNMALPGNGLIYVDNSTTGTCPRWSVRTPEATGQTACGDVLLSGNTNQSLTIAAARDILITGDVTANNNALIGLIANNFVRVRHRIGTNSTTPQNGTACVPGGSPNTNISADITGAPPSGRRTIQAAMLSLGHVFTVDNYQCGSGLGTLTVFGAIAQRYRGPVGTHSGGTVASGYLKDYAYDDRLRYRSPPYFLAPVQSAWRVTRSTEQVPPR